MNNVSDNDIDYKKIFRKSDIEGENTREQTLENQGDKLSFCHNILKVLGFYLIGISCLTPINTIMTGLDCFIVYHKDYYPEFVYTNIFFLGFLVIQFFIITSRPWQNYYILIQISLIIMSIILIIIPMVMFLEQLTSFIITCILINLLGVFSGLLMTCLYSFLIYYEKNYITSVITGHAISGVILNLTRFITVLIYGSNNESGVNKDQIWKSYFIFSLLATFLMTLNIFIWFKFYKHSDIKSGLKQLHGNLYKTFVFSDNVSIDMETQSETEYSKVKRVLKLQFGINLSSCLNGAITFSLFPGILIKNTIFTTNQTLSFLYIMLIFTTFDMTGRQLTKFFVINSKKKFYILTLLRLLFIFIFPCVYILRTHNVNNGDEVLIFYLNDYFVTFLFVIFSLSNGFLISSSFIIMGSDEIDDKLKSKNSSVLSCSLNTGIFLGSTFAYLFNYITDIII